MNAPLHHSIVLLSPQQAAVVEWARSGSGSAFVEAVAGAGKTTTLIELLKVTTGSVNFAAYNTKIANEIKAKVAKLDLGTRVRVGTFHSFGFGAWRRIYPEVKAGPEAARTKADMTCTELRELKVDEGLYSFILKLVSHAKQRAIGLYGAIDDDKLWYDIIDHHDLAYEIEDEEQLSLCVAMAQRALRYHMQLAPKIIDFDDMIYMPIVSGCRMWENDWVITDEAQDTNAARRAMARKMLKPSGRSVWVGDRRQCIYGFAGADSDAIDHIITDFKCLQLPLTITFRCPKAVVAEAQTVVSHIQAHESAPEGSVSYMDHDHFKRLDLVPTDAILCRNTRPLVEMAFSLIRRGVACHVEGRDIGMGLLKLANRFPAKTVQTLRNKLELWSGKEYQKLVAKGKETQAELLRDRVETLQVLLDGCASVDDLRNKIMSMFQDEDDQSKPTITLSTVHKSKGREWPRVFILNRATLMPSPYARQDWQRVQEDNIQYVAITRAQDQLIMVD